jgi:hypothetical protein
MTQIMSFTHEPAVANCADGPGGDPRQAATSMKRERSAGGATRKPSRKVGLIVLLKEPDMDDALVAVERCQGRRGLPLSCNSLR